jgi:tRNA modification GTPase
MDPSSTIAAPATPAGASAIAMLRVSGPLVPAIIQSALNCRQPRHRYATLRPYHNKNGEIIDNIIFIYYLEGHSYTGEHILELMPHGNPFLMERLMEDLLARGCKVAEPGEFTKRAFLNGKLDLTQAEAVQQLIEARSARAAEAARRQLDGAVGRHVGNIRNALIELTAHLEAYIDFPEEDLPTEDPQGPLARLSSLIEAVSRLSASHAASKIIHNGAACVLLGEPNVGKSSLLNALCGEDRAIVSPLPGTTRDYLEQPVRIGSHLYRFIDTAGLHETADALEQEGISRTIKQIERADILIVVLDATQPPPTLPDAVLHKLNSPATIVVHNKCDLALAEAHPFLPGRTSCKVSATSGEGLSALITALTAMLDQRLPNSDDAGILVTARHAGALQDTKAALCGAKDCLTTGQPAELAASHLHQAIDALGAITGRIDNESILDALFQGFCIGK